MNRSKMFYRNQKTLIPKIILTSFLLFFLFFLTNNANAQEKKSNEGQWKSVGGQIVASGKHDFTNFWYSAWRWGTAAKGRYWKNDEDKKNAATHTIEEVTEDVLVKKGQITVRGPGYLAKFQRRIKSHEVGASLKFPESRKEFRTASLGEQHYLFYFNKAGEKAWKWVDRNIVDFDPTKHNNGLVPADETLTLDIWAVNPWSQGDVWWTGWPAPTGIEYEIWFFPLEGGKVIKVAETPGKVVKDDVNDLPPGAAGYIMSIMGSKAGTIVNETTGKILKKGDYIHFGDILITHGVMVKIILNCYPDAPLVVLKANTKIRLENKEKEKKGGIFSFFGKLFFKGNGKDHQGFKIITSNAITGCEGTEFETAYDPNTSKTTVSVFEGTVRMECTNGVINPVIVNAGMQSTMDNNCNHTLSILNPDNNTPTKSGWEIDDEPGTINNIGNKQDGDIVRIEPNSDSHVYAYSYRNWNKSNWGKYENIGAGWNPTGGEKRAFLKFDLAGIDPKSINSATLKLYHNHTGGGNAVDLGVYRVMSSWLEGSGTYHSGQTEKPASYGEISWDNQPEIDRYPVVYFNPGQEINKWIEVDVTSLVKAWLTGIPNHGMAIKGEGNLSGNPESQYGFRSREFEDASKRPHLVLNGSSSIQGKP